MSEEIEVQARELGWRPQEEFQGDPEKFVSAEEFVKRGEQMMPLIKAKNKKLEGEVSRLSSKVQELTQLVNDSQESMSALKELHAEHTKAKVEDAKRKLLQELKQAREDGDVDAEFQITDELTQINAVERAQDKAPPKRTEPKQEEVHPDMQAWMSENSWYGSDKKRTAMANAIAAELRENDPDQELKGREFLDEVARKVDEFFSTPPKNKVEGGRGAPRASGKTYADLPADAKAVCERQASKFVGPGKAFKTKAEWQAYYAQMVLEEE